MRVYFLCFLVFSLLLLSSFLIKTDIFPNNDLGANVVPLAYFKDTVGLFQIPLWNPYIQQGIPAVSDPLYGIYNPVISLPVLLLHPTQAIKMTYFLSVLLACMSMFMLLRFFKIYTVFTVIISLTYASCSYLPGRIHAGHLEKVVSYGLIPLFFLCYFKTIQEKNIMWAGLTALTVVLILFSGDLYGALYALFCLTWGCIFFIWKDKRVLMNLIVIVLLFILFASIKLLPMIELQGYILKTKEPFQGSQNPISILYYLFFPFSLLLSPIFPIRNFLSQSYGWWESICFIGPGSFMGILYICRKLKKPSDTIYIILAVTFILLVLLSMPAFPLNPIHILIKYVDFIGFFHVPSRIFIFMAVIVLIGFGLFLNSLKNKRLAVVIAVLNLIMVVGYSQYIFISKDFEALDERYKPLIRKAASANQEYFLKNKRLGEIPYLYAYENKTFPIRSNYGLHLKNSLNTDRVMPLGELNGQAQPIFIGVNTFSTTLDSSKSGTFTVYQSSYPGFAGYIDGKRSELQSSKFLQLKTIPGKHTYEFRFNSYVFLVGAAISTSSICLWTLYVIKKKYFHFPKVS